jgi:hypothetical protein
MATLEYIKVYIDDLLVITKGSLNDHLDKFEAGFHLIAQCRTKNQCD